MDVCIGCLVREIFGCCVFSSVSDYASLRDLGKNIASVFHFMFSLPTWICIWYPGIHFSPHEDVYIIIYKEDSVLKVMPLELAGWSVRRPFILCCSCFFFRGSVIEAQFDCFFFLGSECQERLALCMQRVWLRYSLSPCCTPVLYSMFRVYFSNLQLMKQSLYIFALTRSTKSAEVWMLCCLLSSRALLNAWWASWHPDILNWASYPKVCKCLRSLLDMIELTNLVLDSFRQIPW